MIIQIKIQVLSSGNSSSSMMGESLYFSRKFSKDNLKIYKIIILRQQDFIDIIMFFNMIGPFSRQGLLKQLPDLGLVIVDYIQVFLNPSF